MLRFRRCSLLVRCVWWMASCRRAILRVARLNLVAVSQFSRIRRMLCICVPERMLSVLMVRRNCVNW